jgi:predicted RNA-binding Zn ribbon-like protein
VDALELANGAEHPALSFLNTKMRAWGTPLELLDSGETYLGWLLSANLIDTVDRKHIAKTFSSAELDEVAARARTLREWLRPTIDTWAASGVNDVPTAVSRKLNKILAADHQYLQLINVVDPGSGGKRVELQARRRWEDPDQLLAIAMESVADLFTSGDTDLVRLCDGLKCSLWFYDHTKSHRRRWCSMAVCGNRDKQRQHRERARADA